MGKVTLTGFIMVPDEDLAAVLEELPHHVRLTQQEDGYLSFSVIRSETEPNRFEVAETFSSMRAFEHHQQRIASSKWGEVTTRVERNYEVREDD